MKIYGVIRTVIYWALTALVIAFVSTLAEIEVLKYFIGGLMVFYGAEEIILTAFKNKKHYSFNSLYRNVFEIVIGLILIIFIETEEIAVAYAIVCVSWAIWSILRETHELVEATEELKCNKLKVCKIVAIVSLIESLTVIALSLTMIIEPGEHHAKIHLYLLAFELFTKVLFPMINYIAERFHEKKNAKAEDTAAERTEPQEADDEVAASEAEIPDMKMKLDGFGLFVNDMAAMLRFYRDVLGFEIKESEDTLNVYLIKDGTLFMLYERKNFEKMTDKNYEYIKGLNGHFEIALYVDTFDEVDARFEEVVAKGAVPVLEPTTEPWGQRTCYIADPEGNLIEIGSFNKPFAR